MDPLGAIGAIASLAGIISAASGAMNLLRPYTQATKEAPKIAASICSEAVTIRIIVTALQQLAVNLSVDNGASVKYACLIQVDQLLAVLTDGVLLFSDLESLLKNLPAPDSLGARLLSSVQWVRKKRSLLEIFLRLQAFKLSINCILSILQSDSQSRAEGYQKELMSNVASLLQSNRTLANVSLARGDAESAFDAASQRLMSIQSLLSVSQPFTPVNGSDQPGTNTQQHSTQFELPFEKDLKASRVYRQAKRDTMDCSIRSSVARTHAWSIFSGISLSNISNVSVLALPLYLDDIDNPKHYARASRLLPIRLYSLSETLYSRSIYHDCREAEMQLLQVPQCCDFIHQERRVKPTDTNPMEILIEAFRHGTPLLYLFNQLDNTQAEEWSTLLVPRLSDSDARLVIVKFLRACNDILRVPDAECFKESDLTGNYTAGHVKVIRLVGELLSRTAAQAVYFDSFPQFEAEDESTLSPRIHLAVAEFVFEERFYVAQLETLLEAKHRLTLAPNMRTSRGRATVQILLSTVWLIADIQRKFLLDTEVLAAKPNFESLSWGLIIKSWTCKARKPYASLISSGSFARVVLQSVVACQSLHNISGGDQDERVGLIRDALRELSILWRRLKKYRDFLEAIRLYCGGNDDIQEATKVLNYLVNEAKTLTAWEEMGY